MNFLLWSTQPAPSGLPPVNENNAGPNPLLRPMSTLESLITDDPFPSYESSEDKREIDSLGSSDGLSMGQSLTADVLFMDKHSDVSEEEGCITIPCSMSSSL